VIPGLTFLWEATLAPTHAWRIVMMRIDEHTVAKLLPVGVSAYAVPSTGSEPGSFDWIRSVAA
jgi:hypothetical protein